MIKKYIITEGTPVLFSTDITHNTMLGAEKSVDSAGFFLIVRDRVSLALKVICMGESTSLAISSRPEIDQEIIAGFLGLFA